jgi:hypothetical protein
MLEGENAGAVPFRTTDHAASSCVEKKLRRPRLLPASKPM